MKNIQEISKIIRSKNASPFELTLDIIIKEPQVYEQLKKSNWINKKLISGLYNIPEDSIKNIIYFDPCYAIKVVFMRLISSGSPGDTDVYGAQQHGPLLDLQVDI